MAGIKDYTSMNYYSSVNNRVRFRRPKFFNKNSKSKVSYVSSPNDKSSYKKESVLSKLLSLAVVLLTFSVIAFLAYITFSYFITVL